MTPQDHKDSDAALLAAFAQGNRAAARALAERLTPRVMGQAMRLLGDQAEAEDVTQEAMLRLWKMAPDWDPTRARVSTWLYTVTSNLCLDRLRKRARATPLDVIEDPVDLTKGAEQQLQEAARVAALRGALAQMPNRQAQAVTLRHLEGMGNARIADIMDTNVRSVESLIARGKRALRACLMSRKAELGYHDDS